MRTKTLLLTAAAVAAGLVSSWAQSNVYSVNIVGYYNVSLPFGLNAVANQLNSGTNRADSVIPYNDGDNIQVWTGVSFTQYTMDSLSGTGWSDAGGDTPLTSLPVLSPGKLFFYGKNGAVNTITFVGQLTAGTNTVNLNASLNAVASPLPYAGPVATGPIALPIADGDNIQVWNGVGFTQTTADSLSGTGWTGASGDVPEPSINVGQPFFYGLNGAPIVWNQVLTIP